jgi:hypothetical protein
MSGSLMTPERTVLTVQQAAVLEDRIKQSLSVARDKVRTLPQGPLK